jgi:hypothetical protein
MTLILNRRTLIRLQRYNDGQILTESIMSYIVYNGHLSLIKYYYHNTNIKNILYFLYYIDIAASYNHLNIVKWLHYNICRGCTKHAMDIAADKGHLDIIIWLHNNRTEGCSSNAIIWASENGHYNVVKWLNVHKPCCTTEKSIIMSINVAYSEGHNDIKQYLERQYPQHKYFKNFE